ncbi:MAG: tRNA preQ1(34) S-adenosylmethionine ribosyltransferase-isomerase QueA [Halobacteriovorax sp.]|nr:tRNA preQ1(34) S-adenosylmethionine ribosyltransferase-isomerase QueA [Halobacteriovorax sp.]|tara:strand:+ start:133064 stop:134110 length:1047 start_codon:yes stop_codon:yes gene_type:complete
MTHPDEDLKLEAYDYELPEELIASRPASERQNSKLLFFDEELSEVQHKNFYEIEDLLPAGTTLVLNQSKVFPCRIFGKKSTGAKAEFFVLSLLKEEQGYPVLIKTGGKKRIGDKFIFNEEFVARINAIGEGTFYIEFDNKTTAEDVLKKIGSVPLPPYIRNGVSDESDLEDYQTVFAKELGSVAAPTAGLHFTAELLEKLKNKGVDIAFVTLHVGLGTFLPVKSELITEHSMHSEKYHVDEQDLQKIKNAKKLVAVGTTSLRVLESMGEDIIAGKEYSTDIFLYPGKEVKSIDGLITNFHLPKSSLIMLVSSLIGRKKTIELYKKAVEKKYRFFSYGDSMFIKRKGRS